MDVCWSRPTGYDAANRNKGPFVRPVTTTTAASANLPFSKIPAVHTQVSFSESFYLQLRLPCINICVLHTNKNLDIISVNKQAK